MAVTSVGRGTVNTKVRDPASPILHVDWSLVVLTLAIASFGILMVFSATRGPGGPEDPVNYFFLHRQGLFVGAGLVLMAVVAAIDYRYLRDFAVPLFGASLLLLVAVTTPLGSEVKGTQAWFQIGGFQFQPAEIAKVATVIALAAYLARKGPELTLRQLGGALAVAGLPIALIMLQPDLGTALVFIAVAMGMLLVGGVRARHVVAVLLAGVIGLGAILTSDTLDQYQVDRFDAFLDPKADTQGVTYNIDQAITTTGAGGLTGAGLFQGRQTRSGAVPEQQTDFIFTVVGEELGFMGSSALLALYGLLLWRIYRIAELARDRFGTLLCVGVFSMLVFQVFQVVGMTTGIMPVTGIPLPLMSYGGSSVLATFLALGIVLSVHMRRFA